GGVAWAYGDAAQPRALEAHRNGVLRVGDQDDFRAPGAYVRRLADQSPVIEHRLCLEDPVDRPAVDEEALPEAAQLDVDDLRREPAVRERGQGRTQSAQLAVLARQRLVTHRAQLEVALRGAQACILGLQPLATLEALRDPMPGRGRGVHRELDGLGPGLHP